LAEVPTTTAAAYDVPQPEGGRSTVDQLLAGGGVGKEINLVEPQALINRRKKRKRRTEK